MNPDKRWWMILILLTSCSPALSQDVSFASRGNNSSASVSSSAWPEDSSPIPKAADKQTTPQPRAKLEQTNDWGIAVYPALAWVPIFGVSVTLPSLPSNPIAPGPSSTTNSSLNGAYFGGARIERNRFSGDILFMWAALSASRTTPSTDVGLDFIFGNGMVGYEVYPNLYAEAGFRRLALDTHATIGNDSASSSPGYWDPLIGLTYRKVLGKKWRIMIHGDGGGFGVGSDVDVAATGRAEWQFVRHVGIAMGYGGMHFSNTTGVGPQTFTVQPTMHGPIFGIGTFF